MNLTKLSTRSSANLVNIALSTDGASLQMSGTALYKGLSFELAPSSYSPAPSPTVVRELSLLLVDIDGSAELVIDEYDSGREFLAPPGFLLDVAVIRVPAGGTLATATGYYRNITAKENA